MSRDSSGTYTAPSNSWNPAVEGTAIDEGDFNTLLDDIEAGLTESVFTAGMGSTDNVVPRTDGTSTKKLQASALVIDDNADASGIRSFAMTGILSTAVGSLTLSNGVNSDIALPVASFARITGPTGSFSVSGFAGGSNGRELLLYNSTSQNMTITNDATSTAANRIYTLTGSDVSLTGTCVARFIYSSTDSRWILTGTQG